jgi:hypothetical protein
MREHHIDLVVLVDGGTDSIIFGDEPGIGSAVEDAVSILAVNKSAGERSALAALGFGIDHYHGVSHHAFLENVATLTRDGSFLGAFSLQRARRKPMDFSISSITPINASRCIGASYAT